MTITCPGGTYSPLYAQLYTHRKFPNSSQCGKLWQHRGLASWTLGIPILVLIEAGKTSEASHTGFLNRPVFFLDLAWPWDSLSASALILPRSWYNGMTWKAFFFSHKCLFHPSLPSGKKYEDRNGIILFFLTFFFLEWNNFKMILPSGAQILLSVNVIEICNKNKPGGK